MSEHPPRRQTVGYETEVLAPERTRIAVEIKAAILIAGALLTAGGAAGMGFLRLIGRIEKLEERAAITATRNDIDKLRDDIKHEARRVVKARVKRLLVRCPREVLRGSKDFECPAVLLPEFEDDER